MSKIRRLTLISCLCVRDRATVRTCLAQISIMVERASLAPFKVQKYALIN